MFGLGFLGLGRGGRAGTRDPFDFESGRGSSNHYDLSGLAGSGGGNTMLSLPPALQRP